MIFDGWHPVTHDFGLIEASVKSVSNTILEWRDTLGIVCKSRQIYSFSEALNALEPLSAEMCRLLIVPTKSDWSAIFQSGISGSDPSSIMPVLAARLKTKAMRVCATPASAKYPATIWENYGKGDASLFSVAETTRTIMAANDGGKWMYWENGEPYEFEEIESYVRPKIKDRFTKDMIARYLSNLSLLPFDDIFYDVSHERPATIVEKVVRWTSPPQEYSLVDVVNGVPWK